MENASRHSLVSNALAALKLDRLEAAVALHDLAVLPGNRLESLKVTGRGSTASASTISGAFALSGPEMRRALPTSRLWIITRSGP